MNVPNAQEILTVGKLGKVYGLKGWLRLYSHTAEPDNIFNYRPWYIHHNNQWHACKPVSHRAHGKGWLVKLAGCDDCDQAQGYVGAAIGVDKAALPPCDEDEFYWHDLIGLRVENTQGECLGVISELINTGANDIMVIVQDKGTEQWVPYLETVVLSVDLPNQHMCVDWEKE